MYVCMYIRIYVCTYVYTYVYTYIRMYIHTGKYSPWRDSTAVGVKGFVPSPTSVVCRCSRGVMSMCTSECERECPCGYTSTECRRMRMHANLGSMHQGRGRPAAGNQRLRQVPESRRHPSLYLAGNACSSTTHQSHFLLRAPVTVVRADGEVDAGVRRHCAFDCMCHCQAAERREHVFGAAKAFSSSSQGRGRGGGGHSLNGNH